MNDLEHQDLPADEQLRRALDGVAGIFESLLRRSDEYEAEIAETRARQQAESDRLRALERSLAADRTALEQMSSVFAEVTRRVAPAGAPVTELAAAAPPSPPVADSVVPERESSDVAPFPNGRLSSLTAADLVAASQARSKF